MGEIVFPSGQVPPQEITWTSDTGQVTQGPVYFGQNSNTVQWTEDTSPTLSLPDVDLHRYPDDALRDLRDRIERHLGPKPPKFKTVEEADAWMEEHYGQ